MNIHFVLLKYTRAYINVSIFIQFLIILIILTLFLFNFLHNERAPDRKNAGFHQIYIYFSKLLTSKIWSKKYVALLFLALLLNTRISHKSKRNDYIKRIHLEIQRGLRVCTKKISINKETKWLSSITEKHENFIGIPN